jgi:hypothetical protein
MVLTLYFLLLHRLVAAVVVQAQLVRRLVMAVQAVAVVVVLKQVELELPIKVMQVVLEALGQVIVRHPQAAVVVLMLLEQQVYQDKQVMAAMV